MKPQFKQLDEASIAKVQALERKLGGGTRVIAFESRPQPTKISGGQLKEIQALENELDAALVAYGPK